MIASGSAELHRSAHRADVAGHPGDQVAGARALDPAQRQPQHGARRCTRGRRQQVLAEDRRDPCARKVSSACRHDHATISQCEGVELLAAELPPVAGVDRPGCRAAAGRPAPATAASALSTSSADDDARRARGAVRGRTPAPRGCRPPASRARGCARRRKYSCARRSRSRWRRCSAAEPLPTRAAPAAAGPARRALAGSAGCVAPGLGRASPGGSDRLQLMAGSTSSTGASIAAARDHAPVRRAVAQQLLVGAVRGRPGRSRTARTRSAWCSHSGDTVRHHGRPPAPVRPRRRAAIRASVCASTAEVGSTSTRISGSRPRAPGRARPAGAGRRTARGRARRARPASRRAARRTRPRRRPTRSASSACCAGQPAVRVDRRPAGCRRRAGCRCR